MSLPDFQRADLFVRRQPNSARAAYPDNVNVRAPLDIYPKYAPDPVRPSDFYAFGKPWEHAWAHTSRFISTSIPQILGVDQWVAEGGRIAKYVRTNIVSVPLGLQHSFVERVNIDRAKSSPYGSGVSVQADPNFTIRDLRNYG